MVSKLPAEILYEIIVQVLVDYMDEYIIASDLRHTNEGRILTARVDESAELRCAILWQTDLTETKLYVRCC